MFLDCNKIIFWCNLASFTFIHLTLFTYMKTFRYILNVWAKNTLYHARSINVWQGMEKFTRITRHRGVALNIKHARCWISTASPDYFIVAWIYCFSSTPHLRSNRGRNPKSQYLDTCIQPWLRHRVRFFLCPKSNPVALSSRESTFCFTVATVNIYSFSF